MTERVDIGDWCTLYHADSTEIVDTLRAHKPDAVIMDPPYGINHVVGAPGGKAFAPERMMHGIAVAGDDTGVDVGPWVGLSPQTVLWGADHLRRHLPDGGRFLAWDKAAGHDFSRNPFSDVEFAWHSRGGHSDIVRCLWKGAIRERDKWEDARRSHPMQKPIRVMEWCIEQCRLEPGALILDPYMGSGTTAIAAFKRRMRFVGCEIDRRWFDVAVARINRQTGDGRCSRR